MNEDQGVIYFYKTRNELSIYRFYKSGEMVGVGYEEGDFDDIKRLSKAATLTSFKKYNLPISTYQLDGNSLSFIMKGEKGIISFKGWISHEDHSLHLSWINAKGNKAERIYKIFGQNKLVSF